MRSSAQFLNAGEAATRLGVSAKALRLYEKHGLIRPMRTEAGWRTYGPDEINRAADIVALRALGLSLAQVARALAGDSPRLEPVLAVHQATLEERRRALVGMIEAIGAVRDGLARSDATSIGGSLRPTVPRSDFTFAFELPWPWGGERFELRHVGPLNYITGPLGSGKTRLAHHLAKTLRDAVFVGLDRCAGDGAIVLPRLAADSALRRRVDRTLNQLIKGGAKESVALIALLAALESEGTSVLVIDMVEQGLDQGSQETLMSHLRRRDGSGRPLFLLTRSTAILDLSAVGSDETILLCPANHSPPIQVVPYPGTPGYEALVTCLASPSVRARTDGVIACQPQVA